jgi:hypothetical protein
VGALLFLREADPDNHRRLGQWHALSAQLLINLLPVVSVESVAIFVLL